MHIAIDRVSRIGSIDTVRGLVMVIMALDHVRELMHVTALSADPLDLATTSPSLFFTRWVTHLCAPTFVFLAGVSAYLSQAKSADRKSNRRFLVTRGLWLVLLEFTVVNFGIWFDIHFNVFLFQVIGAIGLGFIVLGLAVGAPAKVLGLVGLAIACLHNLLPPNVPLFSVGALPLASGTLLIVGYPPVPWIATLLMGYGFGHYLKQTNDRKRLFLVVAVSCISLFLALRLVNAYGDPIAWAVQDRAAFSAMSFLNVSKYPPSLLFNLLMLGMMFFLLYLAERAGRLVQSVFTVYGSVPLFYYILHWYVVHLTLFAVLYVQGFTTDEFVFGFRFGRPEAESGLSLGGVYLVWVGLLLLLYPICRWYGHYKQANRHQTWVRYL